MRQNLRETFIDFSIAISSRYFNDLHVTQKRKSALNLESVVPWGRSFQEYQKMFTLSEEDLKKSILGCGDGPASFNAELTAAGGKVISVDPIYQFSTGHLRSRIDMVYQQIMDQMAKNSGQYIWQDIKNIDHLGEVRMSAMQKFLLDYEAGLGEGRYVNASLPKVPFDDSHFDLALCSHFLFLYSEQIDHELHLAGLIELCRVSHEVRVYPLVALDGNPSPHIGPVFDTLAERGMSVSIELTEYQFQKNAKQMLLIKNTL